MAKISKFEEVDSWKTARELANRVYKITLSGNFSKDFALRDQIRRAAGSAMHNIAEGFDSASDREFLRFLGYARRSASEVQSQLYLALDLTYVTRVEFDELYELATKAKMQLNGFIRYLAKRSYHIGKNPSEYKIDYDGSDDSDDFDNLDYLDDVHQQP